MATIVRRADEVAGDRVEVERVDARRAAVGEVHRGALRAPADPVGDGQVGEHGGAAAVQLQAVQGPGARRLVVGHRAGPEPTDGVARAVVHPHVGAPRLGLSQLVHHAELVDVDVAGARGEHPPTGGRRGDRAHVAIEGDGLLRHQEAVGVELGAVEAGAEDVDPQQLVGLGVPARSFGELSRRGGGAHRGQRPWFGAHGWANSMTTLMSSGPRRNACSTSSGPARRVISRSSHSRSVRASAFAAR